MRTLILEVKRVVNSRPLTYGHEDPEDTIEILTPMKIIQPNRNKRDFNIDTTGNEDNDFKENPEKLIKIWKNSSIAVETFWKHWNKKYLQYLRERADKHEKNKDKTYIPEIGEIVLINDKSLQKLAWNMAKIVDPITGKDGVVRIAKIECKGKILTRAIDLLFPLKLKAESGENIKNKNGKPKNENLVQKINLRPRKNKLC